MPKQITLSLGRCSPTFPDTLPDRTDAELVVFVGDIGVLSMLQTGLKAVEVVSTVILVVS